MTEKRSTIGNYLQNHRKAQNIPLEAVSRLTRISLTSLRHIENEEWDKLPAPVFVRGFLRAFAEAIGTDHEEVLRRYDLNRLNIKQTRGRNHIQSSTRFWWRILLAAIGLAIVIGGTIYVANKMDPATGTAPSSKTIEAATEQGSTEDAPSAGQAPAGETNATESAAEALQPTVQSKELTLLVSAVDATRLKVIADARKPEQYDLKSGDELTLKAESHFSLLIDNAAGVRLTFNGQAIALPNKSGQTLTLQLP